MRKYLSKKVFILWVLPLLVAFGIFVFVRPTLAQIIGTEAGITQYLATNDVEVGEETVSGYRQVYYVYGGRKNFVTEGSFNSRMPHSVGEYMSWVTDINGAGQVYLMHIPTRVILQLTNTSTNLQPKVSRQGMVVWERWVVDRWHVFLFNGNSTLQLTTGDVSVNPHIEDDYVVFSSKDTEGIWRAYGYSISQEKSVLVDTGVEAKFPELKDKKIFLKLEGVKTKVHPLTVEDMFLLGDLPSPTPTPAAPQTVTSEEIVEELNSEPPVSPEEVSDEEEVPVEEVVE